MGSVMEGHTNRDKHSSHLEIYGACCSHTWARHQAQRPATGQLQIHRIHPAHRAILVTWQFIVPSLSIRSGSHVDELD